MTITDLHVHNDDRYPYKYRLDVHIGNLNRYEDVRDWIDQQGIPAVIGPGFGYFRTKEDALLVALRWS